MDLDIKIHVLLDQRFLANVKQLYSLPFPRKIFMSDEKMTMSGGQWVIGSLRHTDFRDTLGQIVAAVLGGNGYCFGERNLRGDECLSGAHERLVQNTQIMGHKSRENRR